MHSTLTSCRWDGQSVIETSALQRVVGIALGHEDLNDHDELRQYPVPATLTGKLTPKRSDCAFGRSKIERKISDHA